MKHIRFKKMVRLYVLAASLIGSTICVDEAITLSGHELIVNTSPSMPRGLYWIALGEQPTRRGEIVSFVPPASVGALIYARGWLAKGMPLLKPVGALAGDTYCVKDRRFVVNDVDAGPVFLLDGQGQPLPQIAGCHRIDRDQFLPVSSHLDRSFDGRYMGALSTHVVLGTGRALLTF
ncbi:MAG TPA: S26 family signal peptidase [Rudaea sp.]|jgi:conjugative transfer signal peptidase TraF|nr:S26 family signal peptidase [Rudaea sp.]